MNMVVASVDFNEGGGIKIAYPCRCGVVHEGDYAYETMRQHHCFHFSGLMNDEQVPEQAICVDCGATFKLVR